MFMCYENYCLFVKCTSSLHKRLINIKSTNIKTLRFL